MYQILLACVSTITSGPDQLMSHSLSATHQEEMEIRSLGRRLNEVRRAAGYTQRELAELIDCSHQTISRYESGEIQISALTLHIIAQRLGITLDSFFYARLSGRESNRSNTVSEVVHVL